MEYNATTKKNELMSFAGTWMKLETIILSKLIQERNTKHHIWELNNENIWTLGGRALGEISNVCRA